MRVHKWMSELKQYMTSNRRPLLRKNGERTNGTIWAKWQKKTGVWWLSEIWEMIDLRYGIILRNCFLNLVTICRIAITKISSTLVTCSNIVAYHDGQCVWLQLLSLQVSHLNWKQLMYQLNIIELQSKKPKSREVASWLFTSMTEDLNYKVYRETTLPAKWSERD